MRPGASAMAQEVVVLAAGVLERICEDRQAVEGTFEVNRSSKSEDCGCPPFGQESHRPERIPCHISELIAELPTNTRLMRSIADHQA